MLNLLLQLSGGVQLIELRYLQYEWTRKYLFNPISASVSVLFATIDLATVECAAQILFIYLCAIFKPGKALSSACFVVSAGWSNVINGISARWTNPLLSRLSSSSNKVSKYCVLNLNTMIIIYIWSESFLLQLSPKQ